MSKQLPILEHVLSLLAELKVTNVLTIDVTQLTTVTDYMVICSGGSSRQVKATAEHVLERMKALSYPALSSQGLEAGEWALIDFGDIVLHIMQREIRSFYNLEGLWQ